MVLMRIRLPRVSADVFRSLRRTTLTLAGFGCLVAALWVVHLVAGLAALGVSCLIVEYLSDEER